MLISNHLGDIYACGSKSKPSLSACRPIYGDIIDPLSADMARMAQLIITRYISTSCSYTVYSMMLFLCQYAVL